MLYDNNRISQVAKLLQRIDKTDIVALVQTDARFVEDIQHIHELRSDLRGKADALALSSRKADGRAVERQVVQPHVKQEFQARAYLLQNLGSDDPLLVVEKFSDMANPFIKVADIHRSQLINILVMDAEMKRFLIQTRPAAFRTYSRFGKLVGPFLRGSRSILVLHHLDILHDSFVKDKIVGSGMDKRTFDFQTLITAIQYFIDDILRQLAHRSLQRSLITFQQSLDLPENHRILVLSQRRDGSFVHRKRTVGYHLVHINQIHIAQPLAARARTLRRIERKVMRSRLAIRKPRHRTHQAFAVVPHTFGLRIQNHQQSVPLLHGNCHALLQARFILSVHRHLVYHHFDVMVLVAVELHPVNDFFHLSVHTHVKIPFLPHLLEKLLIVSLARTDQRSQNEDFPSLIVAVYQIKNLLFGIFHHFFARQV